MAKGSKIVVKEGATLVLNNCRIHNDCGENWDGITADFSKKYTPKIEIIGDVSLENISNLKAR